jgi:hypothetical protein
VKTNKVKELVWKVCVYKFPRLFTYVSRLFALTRVKTQSARKLTTSRLNSVSDVINAEHLQKLGITMKAVFCGKFLKVYIYISYETKFVNLVCLI